MRNNKMLTAAAVSVACCVGVLFSGCYSTGPLLPPHIKSIAIMTFENGTYEPELEIDMADEVINRFIFDGNLSIAREDSADAVLTGTITRYDKDAVRYTEDERDEVTEYRLTLTVDMVCRDVKKNEIMWEEKGFSREVTYESESDPEGQEADARVAAIKWMAKNIVERTIEGW